MWKIVKTIVIFVGTLVLQSWLMIQARKLIKMLIALIKKYLKGL